MLYRSCITFIAGVSLGATTVACTSHVSGVVDEVEPDASAGADGDGGLCEASLMNVTLEPVPPTVQVVIDQSGSMTSRFGTTSRWKAMRRALVDPSIGVVTRLQDRVLFGATLYHGMARSAGTCVTINDVPAGPDTYADIRDLLERQQPAGDTPTAHTLEQVVTSLAPAAPHSRRVILLATDGEPDNCMDPDQHDLYSRVLAEDAAERAYASGVEVLVLSIGDQIAHGHLQRMANAGAGQPLSVGTAPFYVAVDPDELYAAIDAMVGAALPTCKYQVGWDLTEADAQAGRLELDGQPLEYGADWTLADPRTIELLGDACDAALDSPGTPLTGELPCPS